MFETERSTPFTTDAVNRLIKRIGERAGFPFKVHVHMLRHACGYALANQGHDTRAIQDWLGHRAIQHTARYTELSQERFKEFLAHLMRAMRARDYHRAASMRRIGRTEIAAIQVPAPYTKA